MIKFKVSTRWPRHLRRGSAAVRLMELGFRNKHGSWMSVSCKSCVLSGRGLSDGTIPGPEESYRVWCDYA